MRLCELVHPPGTSVLPPPPAQLPPVDVAIAVAEVAGEDGDGQFLRDRISRHLPRGERCGVSAHNHQRGSGRRWQHARSDGRRSRRATAGSAIDSASIPTDGVAGEGRGGVLPPPSA